MSMGYTDTHTVIKTTLKSWTTLILKVTVMKAAEIYLLLIQKLHKGATC